jgi:hypothetical protein
LISKYLILINPRNELIPGVIFYIAKLAYFPFPKTAPMAVKRDFNVKKSIFKSLNWEKNLNITSLWGNRSPAKQLKSLNPIIGKRYCY